LPGALALGLAAASPLALAQSAPSSPAPAPGASPAPARPAAGPAKPGGATNVAEVDVNASEPPGAVIGDIKPEIVLTPDEVQSYGVSTVDDLLNELAPQTSTGPGSSGPIILLNGRRIAGYYEVRDVPTEAILRVEILPQEAALKFGYSADQRVVNIILKPLFNAKTAELDGGAPTWGGQIQDQGQLDYIHINHDARLNMAFKVVNSSDITDAARGIGEPTSTTPYDPDGNVVSTTPGAEIDPALSALAGHPVTVAGVPPNLTGAPTLSDFLDPQNASDVGSDRTLTGSSTTASGNFVYAHPLGNNLQATVNGMVSYSRSESLQGLPTVSLDVPAGDPFSPFSTPVDVAWNPTRYGPLTQVTQGWTGHLGTSIYKDTSTWRFTLTSSYDHTYSQTVTDTGVDSSALQDELNALDPDFNPFAPINSLLPGALLQNYAASNTDTAQMHILASGPIPGVSLPAGQIRTTIHAGDTQSWFSSTSTIAGVTQPDSIWRNDLNGRLNLDAPITKHAGFLGFAGDLTFNGNAAIDRLSDFGPLFAYGYGANWRPNDVVSLLFSHTHDQQAPTFTQLDGPVVVTPDARVLDFVTGQTVDVNMVSGGNPELTKSQRDINRITLTIRPLPKKELIFTSTYNRTFTQNPIETFPAATAQIQDAFPDRFIRDDDDELTEVDYRPINFLSEDRAQLRTGVNYTFPFGKPAPRPRRDEERGRFGGRGFGRGFRGQGGQGGETLGGGQIGEQGPGPGDEAPSNGQPPGEGAQGAPGQQSADGTPPNLPFGRGGGGFGGGGGGGGGGGFRGGGGGFGGGRGGGGRGGPDNSPAPGRIQLALYHTITFEDTLVARPGGPVFSTLDGYPTSGGGGLERHLIEAQAGITWKGLGARASATWQSATFLSGDSSPTGPLTFSAMGSANLRMWADFAQMPNLVRKHPWLSGTRVTFSVTNITNAHERVLDSAGQTPLTYSPAYLDPVGRVVKLGVRKLFN
jgi:hypothetical protein